jgi:Fe2+ or Zn2+ uptake regulation protein
MKKRSDSVNTEQRLNQMLSKLKDITAEVVDETGFDILSHRLDFFGICGDCKRE